jgi:hypothetical protein
MLKDYNITDMIKPFLVKIIYKDQVSSGCIINPSIDCDYIYIVTAAHLIKGKDFSFEEQLNKIENIDDLQIYSYDSNLIEHLPVVYYTSHDLCMILALKSSIAFELTSTTIHNALSYDYKDFYMIGYPELAKNNIGYFKLEFQGVDNNLIKLKENRVLHNLGSLPTVSEALNGLSGAGLFYINDESELELLGLHIESYDSSVLVAIDLSILIEELNSVISYLNTNTPDFNLFSIYLNDKIHTSGQKISISDISVENFKTHLGYNETNINYDFIKDLEFKFSQHKKETKVLAKDLGKLALYYREKGDYKKSRETFKKVINIKPDYKRYFLETKNTRTDNAIKRQVVREALANYDNDSDIFTMLSKLNDIGALLKCSYDFEHPLELINIIKNALSLILEIQVRSDLSNNIINNLAVLKDYYFKQLGTILNNFYDVSRLSEQRIRYISGEPYFCAGTIFDQHNLYTEAYYAYRFSGEIIKKNNNQKDLAKLSKINELIYSSNLNNRSIISSIDPSKILEIENSITNDIESLYSQLEKSILLKNLQINIHENNIDECIALLTTVKDKINYNQLTV